MPLDWMWGGGSGGGVRCLGCDIVVVVGERRVRVVWVEVLRRVLGLWLAGVGWQDC